MNGLISLLVLGIARSYTPAQQGYLGADRALREISGTHAVAPKIVDPNAAIKSAIQNYNLRSDRMTPDAAARGWLSLVDRCPPQSGMTALEGYGESQFPSVMTAIPGPAAWPALESAVRTRLAKDPKSTKDRCLLAMVETLLGRRDQTWRILSQTEGLTNEQKGIEAHVLIDLSLVSSDKNLIDQAYRNGVRALSLRTEPIGGEKSLEIPDFVSLLGATKAGSLLRDIFEHYDGEVQVNVESPTGKLATEVALQSAGSMLHPQWSIADQVNGGPLFEAIHRKFPTIEQGNQQNMDGASSTFGAAATRYTMYLVASGRTSDALAFAKDQATSYWYGIRGADDEVKLLKSKGKLDEYLTFLETMINGGNKTAATSYKEFCSEVGQDDRAKGFLAKLPATDRNSYEDLAQEQANDLIGKHQVLQAGELLSRAITQDADTERARSQSSPNRASMLVDIGRFLHRKDFIDQGIAAEVKALSTGQDLFTSGSVVFDLIRENRAAEAESLLAKLLHQSSTQTNTFPPGTQQELAYLVQLYARLNRWKDVVTLLDTASGWEADDIAIVGDKDLREGYVPFLAAKALYKVGRKAEALHILKFVLQTIPDLDQAYDLLISMDPIQADTILDRMHAANPLNTRPIMWKAKLLHSEGKQSQAAAMAQRALALDPNDTEAIQSSTRFQGWQILSVVEEAQGKKEDARAYAQKFASQGKYLINDRTDGFRTEIEGPAQRLQALRDNRGDFDLQFAIADDYRSVGDKARSREQYLAAYASMCSQLGDAGAVSYHEADPAVDPECEAMLQKMVASKPEARFTNVVLADFYRLAGSPEKAVGPLGQAIKQDPDCRMAWTELDLIRREVALPQDLIDEIGMNMARLSPGEPVWPALRVRDLGKLWRTANSILRNSITVEDPIYTLPASAFGPVDRLNTDNQRRFIRPPTAGSTLAADQTVKDLGSLLSTVSGAGRE